jgi:acyl-coenzyme A thioesterase PaaI-like protein
MNQHKDAIGEWMMKIWQRLAPWPGGRWLFSRLVGYIAPYTGTIGASVKVLRPGYARVELRDRRKVRNHLNSIHAIALMNLGEVTTGLALMTGLKPGIRGIITGLSIEYFKKARGRLVSVAETMQPEIQGDLEHEVIAEIRDQSGDVVARCTARWRLGFTP